MKKKVACCALSIVMLLSLCVPAFAVEANTGYDTLSKTQAEYELSASSLLTRIVSSETTKIENTCKSFLSVLRASVRSEEYSPEAFISSNSLQNETIQYRLSEYEYLAAIREMMNAPILSDNIQYSGFACTIDRDSASASIVESYTYYTDEFDGENFRCREYAFSLLNNDGVWEICEVTTNDPWEIEESFTYEPIDIETSVQAKITASELAEVTAISTSVIDPVGKVEPTASSLYKWTYDTSAAVEYAGKYYKSYNTSLFSTNTGNDCQNFASQCVWAGLRRSSVNPSSNGDLPALSSTYLGSTDYPNLWRHNYASTYYDYYRFNWTWDSAQGFANMIEVSKTTTEGPFGNTHYGNLKYAAVGSVISWAKDGDPGPQNLDHAMFVTGATGTVGARTMSNLKIAAHTSNTNTAAVPLVDYANESYADSYFATCVISCGYYASAQP